MEFYTAYKHPVSECNKLGSRYEKVYQEYVDDNGHLTIECVSLTDRYAKIQAHAEECKIENILHAAAMGDLSSLKARDLSYGDATMMPKSLMEAQNLVIRMKNEFNEMPYEVRKEFNNSPERYVQMMGTPEFNEIMAPFNKKIAEIQEAGNLKAYQKKVAEEAKFRSDVAAAMEGGKE